MIQILRKALPEIKDVGRHTVYNIRLRARRRELALTPANVEVTANNFDASFIKDYRSNSDNYSKGMLFIKYYSCCLVV